MDLARNLVALETADQASQLLIVSGVERIENGLRAFAGFIEGREQIGNAAATAVLSYHIEPGVRAHFGIHAGIIIALAGIVELHGNTETVIFLAEVHENSGLILFRLLQRQRFAGHGLFEGSTCFLYGGLTVGDIVKAVIAGTAAERGKVLQTVCQCFADASCALDFFTGYSFQFFDVLCETGLCDIDGLVRAEGGAHLEGDGGICRDFLVPFQ